MRPLLSEDLALVQERLLWRAYLMSSPPYTGLLERRVADVAAGVPAARVLRGHGADPPNAFLARRRPPHH